MLLDPWVGNICLCILEFPAMSLRVFDFMSFLDLLFVTALFSPDDLFVLIEGFWRLAVFDEA
jgi:hypothetical protein